MKKMFSIIMVIAILIGITGCAPSGQPKMNITLYTPMKSDEILQSTYNYVKNGVLYLDNGDRIIDEEGDIIGFFDINGKSFYILKKLDTEDNKIYKIKNINKQLIKEFRTNGMSWFSDGKHFVIAIILPGNHTLRLYDNVYSFDGTKFKLINKNLTIPRSQKSGMYYISYRYNQDRLLIDYTITNVLTGKTLHLKDIKQYTGCNHIFKHPLPIGIAGDKLIYICDHGGGGLFKINAILGVLDLKTNKSYVLMDGSNDNRKINFLKTNYDVVLRIFNDPNLKPEIIIDHHVKDVQSKYDNLPAKYIWLNTLQEVRGISDKFKIVPRYGAYTNISDRVVLRTSITYDLLSLILEYKRKKRNNNLTIMF